MVGLGEPRRIHARSRLVAPFGPPEPARAAIRFDRGLRPGDHDGRGWLGVEVIASSGRIWTVARADRDNTINESPDWRVLSLRLDAAFADERLVAQVFALHEPREAIGRAFRSRLGALTNELLS